MADNDNGEVGVQEELPLEQASADDIEAEMMRRAQADQFGEQPEPEVQKESDSPSPESSHQEPQGAELAAEEPPPADAEPPAEPEFDEQELREQEIQLQMNRLRQEREQFEVIAGRSTGEIGFLKKELERLRQLQAQPQPDPLDYPAEIEPIQPQPQRAPSALEGQVAELYEGQRESAIASARDEFLNQLRTDLMAQGVKQEDLDVEQNAIIEGITPGLQDRFKPFGDTSVLNPKAVAKVTRMVLQGAYTDYQLAKVAELRKQASERKAQQIAENKIAKQAAVPSGSGGRPAQEPPPKSLDQATAEEVDAELIRRFGTGEGLVKPRH